MTPEAPGILSASAPAILPEPNRCFLVRVSTGCTCCANENFIQGPYLKEDDADACAAAHKRYRTLSSQYAENGRQELLEVPYEVAGG